VYRTFKYHSYFDFETTQICGFVIFIDGCCIPLAEIGTKSGLLKFSKNLGAISELYVPEGWYEESVILRAQKY